MDIHYYPGCTIKASAQSYETSALAVLRALEIRPIEMEQWNCCGVSHSLVSDNLMRQVAPTRVFTRLQQQGSHAVMTLCDMCYNTLARTNRLLQHEPEKAARINQFIDTADETAGYQGQIDVLHLLQVLRDHVGLPAIQRRVTRPLTGLVVFPYYGCKLLRPREVGIDDTETPTVLGDLMRALGASIIDDPFQTQCCGSSHVVDHDEVVAGRVTRIVDRAQQRGAMAMVLSCPLCQFNLDSRQQMRESPLPIFYFTQLMGLAFGVEPAALGLDDHRVDPLPLLVRHHVVSEGALHDC